MWLWVATALAGPVTVSAVGQQVWQEAAAPPAVDLPVFQPAPRWVGLQVEGGFRRATLAGTASVALGGQRLAGSVDARGWLVEAPGGGLFVGLRGGAAQQTWTGWITTRRVGLVVGPTAGARLRAGPLALTASGGPQWWSTRGARVGAFAEVGVGFTTN